MQVEDIIDHKIEGRRKLYLIRWKGYGADSDTWEEEKSIFATDLLAKYKTNHPDDVAVSRKKKPGRQKKPKEIPPKKIKIDQMPGYNEEENDDTAEWEVERVIDVHFKKDNSREFLIRWKDYSSKSDTWEPESNLDCKELIDKFMEKVGKATVVSQKQLRVAPVHTQRFTLMEQSSGRRLSKRHGAKQR